MRAFVAVVVSLGALVAPAYGGLADLVPGLFERDIFLAPDPDPQRNHATHFLDEQGTLRATGRGLNQALAAQLATFPLPSPSGGFTYRFDPAAGTLVRSTDSFGPLFMERAQTLGDGQWTVGISYQQTSYSTLDDLDLEDGTIEFQLLHEDLPPPPPANLPGRTDPFFEGDLINVNMFLEVESRTTVFFANYGVTDRFDLSLGVPLVSVDLDAAAVLTVDPLGSEARAIHRFPDGSTATTFTGSGDASGIGDVLARGKYRFWESGGSGAALLVDLRLPTGDEEDLLGTGVTQGKFALVGSWSLGRFSPHVNAGYTVSEGDNATVGELPDEINYAFGFDVAATPRLTFNAELLGRLLQDAVHLERREETFQFRPGPGGVVTSATRPVVRAVEGDENLLLGVAGVRFNPTANLLVSLAGLFNLGDDGLQSDDPTFAVSFDYSF